MFTKEFLLSYYYSFKDSTDASKALESLDKLDLLDDKLKANLEEVINRYEEIKAKIKEYISAFIPDKVKLELGEFEIEVEVPFKYKKSIAFLPAVCLKTRTECVRLIFDEKFMRFYLKHEHSESENKEFLRKNFKLLLRSDEHLIIEYKTEE